MQFNDVRLQYEQLSHEIESAIAQVLSGGRYILGPAVEAFEEEFARFCGASFGVGVASGTDAIRVALAAAGVGAGDEVLTPAVSAAATAMAVAQLRAIPVFVDVRPDDFTMDPEDAFQRVTGKTRAILPVHLYGMPARLKELGKIGLPIVEDAAQAHGSAAVWGRCGSFGIAAAFSFYPTKNLGSYGDAGMMVTSDPHIATRVRLLRNYGQREQYASEILGDNSRLDEIHAAVLRLKLGRLESWNARRAQIAEVYREGFRNLPLGLQLETGKSNYHLFVVTTPRRDELRRHLLSLDIPSLVHYPIPLPAQEAFAAFGSRRCPHADLLCSRVLSLPMHASLADHEVERVISAVSSFFSAASARNK